jgi:A/G-specific adenine glycosylase
VLRTIRVLLEKWYRENKRDLPWRGTASPYHIWLSEIILQQTRVSQGLEYYNRFVEKYPSVHELADAPMDEVLKMWQGLGYYTRARNLHDTARVIVRDHQGAFPRKYEELLRLKGIGSYTAAAIASMAFKEPVALVDGNVYRVLSRLFGIDSPIDATAGKKVFEKLAARLLDPEKPDIHNQAVMEFGALVCLPKNPDCGRCILSDVCIARKEGKTSFLPVKKGKGKARERHFYYLFVQFNESTLLHKRTGNDIWNSLYEFPLIESDHPLPYETIVSHPVWKALAGNGKMKTMGKARIYNHKLTHQKLHCTFYRIRIDRPPDLENLHFSEVSLFRLPEYAVPRIIDKYLADLKQEGI